MTNNIFAPAACVIYSASGIGFAATQTTYEYDDNGNLTKDTGKNITSIEYNYLNLPYKITFSDNRSIEWLYDATGNKLRKTVKEGTTERYTQDYMGSIEYRNSEVEAIYHAEGRATLRLDGSFLYEYTIKDHLGNSRVTFSDADGDNSISQEEILQESHYYPFGMSIDRLSETYSRERNDYLYNGSELQSDFGLGINMMPFRSYDPTIGRFWQTDPVTEMMLEQSPYHFAFNNPIRFNDPLGLMGEPTTEDLISQAWNDTPEGENKEFHYNNDATENKGDCCPDIPDDFIYQTIWTPIEDFVGNYIFLPFIETFIVSDEELASAIRRRLKEQGLDLSSFSDEEVLANVRMRKAGGEIVFDANPSFMNKLVEFGFSALDVAMVFSLSKGGGAGVLMGKGGLPGFKIISNNIRANTLAKSAGYENAHSFKAAWKTSGKDAHWNMLYNSKTGQLGLRHRTSGIEFSVNAYVP